MTHELRNFRIHVVVVVAHPPLALLLRWCSGHVHNDRFVA